MATQRRVGLIFGGSSVEHEVSVVSARAVAAGLETAGMACIPLGVTAEDRWLPPELSEKILDDELARVEAPPDPSDGSRVRVDPGQGLVQSDPSGRFRPLSLDAVFPLIHGWGGEDGRIQGLLELAGLPYVGSGVLGSAIGMDKEVSKTIFEHHGLPVGPWESFRGEEYRAGPGRVEERLVSKLGFPVFVKPANGGSSVGIGLVKEPKGLAGAIEEALRCDDKVVVEVGLEAREVECAVLGNDDPEASVPGEIVPTREFYDYVAKYEDESSQLLIPAPLSSDVTETVRRLSLVAYRALSLAGLARVDFLVERSSDRVYVNEVNTLPGFTPISMFPKLWEASGVAYPELLDRLVGLALDRWKLQRRRAVRRRP